MKTFHQIAEEAAEEWPGSVLGIVHRTGRLQVGEASVVIVAAAAHRAESFAVCRYAIERVKQIAPVWKHEFFEDGQAWVEGAVANPVGSGGATARARTGMRVTVQLFARLRELAGRSEATCELAPGASVADVWRALEVAHPAIAPLGASVSAAVNAEFAPMTTPGP